LPDSALTTYFGKPAFHAYGNGNSNPVNGGIIYGDCLKTHNINPHSGGNNPKFSQVHVRALMGKNLKLAKRSGSLSPSKGKGDIDKGKVEIDIFSRMPIPPRVAPGRNQHRA